MKIPVRMIFDDLPVGHARFRLNPERETEAGGFQRIAERLETIWIIPGAGKPVAAILPPRISLIGFGPERVTVPAGVDGIKLDRDFMVVNPLDVGDLGVDRL